MYWVLSRKISALSLSAGAIWTELDKRSISLVYGIAFKTLDWIGTIDWHKRQLNNLVKSGIVEDYPPLNEKQGTYSAQFEHASHPPSSFLERNISLTELRQFYFGLTLKKWFLAEKTSKRIRHFSFLSFLVDSRATLVRKIYQRFHNLAIRTFILTSCHRVFFLLSQTAHLLGRSLQGWNTSTLRVFIDFGCGVLRPDPSFGKVSISVLDSNLRCQLWVSSDVDRGDVSDPMPIVLMNCSYRIGFRDIWKAAGYWRDGDPGLSTNILLN